MGHWTADQGACDGACPQARMLPCAPIPGTEILTERIPVGSRHGDSARASHAGKGQHVRGEEGGTNASLEALAG